MGSELYYYHQDEQLSTALVTDDTGRVRNYYQYDAFGGILAGEEGVSSRIRYTGQQYDEISEQYYLRARYYNPVVGRFLQEDVYEGDGLNLYAYCRNNPVRYYDPSGYASTDPYGSGKQGGDGGEEKEGKADFYVTPDGQVIHSAGYNLPKYHPKEATTGVLILPTGEEVYFVSNGGDPKYKNYRNNGHVEQQAAMYMKDNDIDSAVMYHNNTGGTCGGCHRMTGVFLNEGSKLTVVPPINAKAISNGALDIPKTFVGTSKIPKIDKRYRKN